MKIERTYIAQSAATADPLGQSPLNADIGFFGAAMSSPLPVMPTQDNIASRIMGQLSQYSESLQKLSERSEHALQKAAKTAAPMDMIKANRALSSFYLESVLTAKIVSKSAQAVEKLTNLQ